MTETINLETVEQTDALAELLARASSQGHITYDEIHAQIAARDTLDRTRKISPLLPAKNAHLLDTSDLGIEAAFEAAINLIDNN